MRNVRAFTGDSILASRRGSDILIADDPVRIDFVWDTLRTSDDEEVRVTWTGQIVCVDSPADRTVMAERFLVAGSATLATQRVAAELSATMRSAVAEVILAKTADALLGRHAAADVASAIEKAAKSAAFAAGLGVLPPFGLTVDSPARERERRAIDTRDRLAAMSADDASRAKAMADVARILTESGTTPGRVRHAIDALRLGDSLDVLRATALVDPTWSAAEPSLWIAAGSKLVRLDPTKTSATELSAAMSIPDATGPIRSVQVAQIDGETLVLLGVRDGVIATRVEGNAAQVVKTFRHPTGVDFGFNSVCYLAADRLIIASHSRIGLVVWRWDAADQPATVFVIEAGARSVRAIDTTSAVCASDGVLAKYSGETVVNVDERQIAFADSQDETWLLRDDSRDVRYAKSTGVQRAIDVGGITRTIRPLSNGGLEMADESGGSRLLIGPSGLAARSVATRPGFAAAVSVDRSHVSLIDLARPEMVAVDFHIAATLGHRVADVVFG